MTRSDPLRLALGGALALAAAMGVGRFVYTPILPPMAEAMGLTNAAAGLIAAANFLGYLLGALAAALPLPGTRRAWLLGALAASAATTAAMGLAATLPAFLSLRLAGGVASAFVFVFAAGLVLPALAASGRPGLAAVAFGGVGLGIAGSAALVAGLGAAGADWRGLWLASGGASLAALVGVGGRVPAAAEPGPAAKTADAADAGTGASPRLVLAYGLFGFGYVITATFLVAIVRADPALRPFEPWAWVLVGLAAAPSVALWSGIAARIGTLRAFAVAALVQAVGVAASVVRPSVPGLALAALLLGGTFMGMTALGVAAVRERGAGDPRRAIALLTASFGLGQIVGPAYAGVTAQGSGGFLAPSLTAVAALLVAAGLAVSLHRPR